jgi:hypothetical protein
VVPSHWYDTNQYQETGLETLRAVTILDKKSSRTVDNFPFTHIMLVNSKDGQTSSGLKKAIRLCKNVKSDAENEGKSINFPSFDIAATMYHADTNALGANVYYELSVLAETQRFLDYLTMNEVEAKKLLVPDGSRPIFDDQAKLAGLRSLSLEMDDLLRSVAMEQNPYLGSEPSLSAGRATIQTVFVPTN